MLRPEDSQQNVMAHYEIKSLNDSKTSSSINESLPREGLVNDVCREWLMHEDQALAYRLQSEEYQHHLGHNRQRNAILRKDTPRAREEQLKEDEEAARAQTQLEMELARQEARDAAIAAAIGEDLDRQEQERERVQELKDRELAKKLIEEEKSKVRQMKEIRQVEREAAYLGINSGLDNVAILSRKDKRGHRPTEEEGSPFRRVASLTSDDLADLSDFCIQPSSSMDEEEMRRLQEDQDEELARLLQEQDLKRRGDLMRENQLLAIEAQDKELAKVLQEQERAKAKKAREKARQKALLKQQHQVMADGQQSEQSPPPRPPKALTPSKGETSPDQFESPQYATITTTAATPTPSHLRPNSPQYATPMVVAASTSTATSSFAGEREAGGTASPTRVGEQKPKESERVFPDEKRTHPSFTPPPSAFPNIACAIDPTYQRRVRQGELSPSPSLPPLNQSPTSPGPSKAPVPPPVFEEEEDYLPPPYMPIQGQRRTASLEKRKGSQKSPKEKVDKSGCKQQ